MRILSISDLITNSSTECFVFKMDDKYKEIDDEIRYWFTELHTLDDIRNAIASHDFPEVFSALDEPSIIDLEYNNTDENWEKVKKLPVIQDLVGRAMGYVSTDSGEEESNCYDKLYELLDSDNNFAFRC